MDPTLVEGRPRRRARPALPGLRLLHLLDSPAGRDLIGALALSLAVMLAVGVSGCGGSGSHSAPTSTAGPLTVETLVLDSSAIGALVLPARIKAREEVVVSARTSGRVTELAATEGQRVRAGQPLARFDAPESRRALLAARRERDAALLSADIARRQQARVESLFAAHVTSDRDRELADAEHRAAEAQLETAGAALESMEAALEVRAPFDGIVARRHVDAGADVQPGTPLFTVRSSDATEIEVPIPEAALPALAGARLSYQSGNEDWRPARLARVDGMTDFNTRTRTAHLLPRDGSAPEPGAYARVRLESSRLPDPSLPRLPASSLVRRGELTGAFVIEEGHAVLRWLKLGREQGGTVEVLSGLFPGERVARVAAGLSDGAPVRVAS